MLSQDTLEKRLNRPVRFFPQVESTQDIALDWLRDGAETGAVVVADEQVAGRGRRGRDWVTPPGTAIALSVILRPPREAIAQVTMLGALAIAEMLDGLGLTDVKLKWPNDVQLNGRKVCGVLPEAVWDGDRLRGVALGMGINVRVDFTGTTLEKSAISIETALAARTDRSDIVVRLLDRIDARYAQIGTPALFDAWRLRLATLGQHVEIFDDDGLVRGTAEAVDARGALLVRTAAGDLRHVLAGDVTPPQTGHPDSN